MGIACYESVHTYLRLCGCYVITIIPKLFLDQNAKHVTK